MSRVLPSVLVPKYAYLGKLRTCVSRVLPSVLVPKYTYLGEMLEVSVPNNKILLRVYAKPCVWSSPIRFSSLCQTRMIWSYPIWLIGLSLRMSSRQTRMVWSFIYLAYRPKSRKTISPRQTRMVWSFFLFAHRLNTYREIPKPVAYCDPIVTL